MKLFRTIILALTIAFFAMTSIAVFAEDGAAPTKRERKTQVRKVKARRPGKGNRVRKGRGARKGKRTGKGRLGGKHKRGQRNRGGS